ncbi:L-cysteine:1D-myo-inositol 2-amino-2-deoxy-alpha-D-glucopyranoside ligase [Motilibacter rhizosphaerae]|uniref:L-cysteine:1D-myo-inositol 2-amino-2-deoxy-alpha-D-glucopyranoside ligase n=1 Tax=Motilibacter rhizosphaerae TaxID=598652 RepID=A0A4Q7NB26_9ACTN|nr:cysteine--1-D-myo-inosityl 2-amino-2-deoxy-alpha-D-glucopyranoside ligase [Motilibacter rhizosphaerae]RZS80053.1 L-cysteine:1D-myo-inositol 2-amino-2-deoxy-alpha-D-glucopyranoside ligase [Motilibacter rhizosphaerae]
MHPWPAPAVPALPGRGSQLVLHDSATGTRTAVGGGERSRLYVCGITPYDATHLGHAATYVAFDLVQRVWRDAGSTVSYVQNVTDVDDPLLERAAATGVDWRDLAARETALFCEDMAALGVLPPDRYVAVTEVVPQIAEAVARMLEGGSAYRLDEDVYFAVDSDPAYGGVAHLDDATARALSAERGGDPDRPGKRGPLDPLLWRGERPGEPAWDSPVGRGRPGWHVECTVIALSCLGGGFEVQGGGRDLVFPHHEMSASHSHALGEEFAQVYAHAGLVAYEGEKISKSRGNLVLVSRLRAQGVDPAAVRLAILAHHYRSEWEWTDEVLAEAVARLGRWQAALGRNEGPDPEPVLAGVRAAMADDLDAPAALALVDDWAARAVAGEGEQVPGAPGLVARTVDALLGVRL